MGRLGGLSGVLYGFLYILGVCLRFLTNIVYFVCFKNINASCLRGGRRNLPNCPGPSPIAPRKKYPLRVNPSLRSLRSRSQRQNLAPQRQGNIEHRHIGVGGRRPTGNGGLGGRRPPPNARPRAKEAEDEDFQLSRPQSHRAQG